MLFLFPADYFDIKQVDYEYTAEYEAVCKMPEFKTILFNYDSFIAGEPVRLYPKDYYVGDCVYRGWMLTPEQYAALYSHLKTHDITLINTPDEYNTCHMFPYVRDALGQDTPNSIYFPKDTSIDWNLANNAFKRFMVKDYVKSEKNTKFPTFFTTPVDPETMDSRIAEFRKMRGSLFTGGIVLKDYVDLKRYGDCTNEYRAFYLHENMLSLSRNSNQPDTCPTVTSDFVRKFSNLHSRYYTVDFAELANGSWIILETGDGQVSGLSPGQWVFKYYDDMRAALSEE